METKTATTPQNRGGRPPKKPADRKTVEVKVYLTPRQKTKLQQRQKKAGYCHLAAYISDAALNGQTAQEVVLTVPPEVVRELSIIGKNINQLAKHKNSCGEWHHSFNDELKGTKAVMLELFELIVANNKNKGARK